MTQFLGLPPLIWVVIGIGVLVVSVVAVMMLHPAAAEAEKMYRASEPAPVQSASDHPLTPQKDPGVSEPERIPRVWDISTFPTDWLWRSEGGGRYEVVGDMRDFSPKAFPGRNQGRGLKMQSRLGGQVFVSWRDDVDLSKMEVAVPGDYFVFPAGGKRVVIKVDRFRKDPSYLLPKFEASGREVPPAEAESILKAMDATPQS